MITEFEPMRIMGVPRDMISNISVILLMLILSIEVNSQSQLPFELERFEEFKYSSQLYLEQVDELSADELLAAYLNEYKRQRALNPSEYFVSPTSVRSQFGDLLKEKQANHPGEVLIKFLEEGCSRVNLVALTELPAKNKVLLPYQAMAAFAIEDEDKEIVYLNGMLREGMISDVMKAWGNAALASAKGYQSIMTNGMQDLLAVRYAQLMKDMEPDIEVGNRFVQKCNLSDEASALGSMWFAPTVENSVIAPFAKRLKVVGIGFSFQLPEGGDRLSEVAGSLTEALPKTPADRGLVSSYAYLQKALENKDKKTEAKKLKKYIDQEGLR